MSSERLIVPLRSQLPPRPAGPPRTRDRKSTRLNSSHTVIYTLSLHDALPISGELLHVKAEIDELRALDRAAAQPAAPAARRPAPHQIQAHALEAQLEVDDVHGLDLAEHRLSAGVDCLVGEECHRRLCAGARPTCGR